MHFLRPFCTDRCLSATWFRGLRLMEINSFVECLKFVKRSLSTKKLFKVALRETVKYLSKSFSPPLTDLIIYSPRFRRIRPVSSQFLSFPRLIPRRGHEGAEQSCRFSRSVDFCGWNVNPKTKWRNTGTVLQVQPCSGSGASGVES